MSIQVQSRRGSAASHASFTGAPGEITSTTDTKRLVLHDGSTVGGIPVARLDEVDSDTLRAIGNANFSFTATDRLVVPNAAFTAVRTGTLPAAADVAAGRTIVFFDSLPAINGANTLTVARSGSDTINGATSYACNIPRGRWAFTSDGVSAWAVEVERQPRDAMLTALAALAAANNKVLGFTGDDAPALYDWTAWGRARLNDADAAASRAALAVAALADLDGFIDGLEISTDGGNAITVSAGVCVADGMVMRMASAMTKSINASWAAGTGVGCLDAGAEAADAAYYISIIGNPTTGAVDFIASASASSPDLPDGFTARFDLPPVLNDSSSNLRPIVNFGDEVRYSGAPVLSYTNTSFGAGARTLVALAVPALRCEAILNCHFYAGPSTAGAVWVTSPDDTDANPSVTSGRATAFLPGNASLQFSGVRVSTANGQVGVRFADGMSGGQVYIATVGFTYPRGRHR
ncbi:MAG TPA: hypothetical protein VGV17_02960 [Bosea sp. (in: a-proteobacteria)]|jgi:hypothetical protein|uniref:hyaluronate lyase N-terminal domain-containing protein n=1 Tax=Bosea sp. (in: a-proteobacteria) TaxID=1871050 RepID=UPI002DDCD1EE|nr:hypothetical protein [Bosea sp. (in: a-proteobacteria)]HEV2552705.1 hypothetical protein [Bosea sp. (in: a-proteobacteria)]